MNFENQNLETTMRQWLFECKKPQVSNGTFEKLLRSATLYVFPYLGKTAIPDIKTEDVQNLITNTLYKEKNLSSATGHKCRCLLNNFFNYCIDADYIKENPVTDTVAKNQEQQTRREKANIDEYLKIADAVSASRFWKPFCLTIMNTAIRISEILPLTWSDVDFDNKVIKVNKYVVPTIGFSDTGTVDSRLFTLRPIIERHLPLSDSLAEVLQVHKKYREREQRQIKNKYSYIADTDLVFGNDESGLRSYSGLSHNYRKFLKSQGLDSPNITLNSLRRFTIEQMKYNKAYNEHFGEVSEPKPDIQRRGFVM